MYYADGGIEIFQVQGFESGGVCGVQFTDNLFYQWASGLENTDELLDDFDQTLAKM